VKRREKGEVCPSFSSYSPVFTKQFQTVKSRRSQGYEVASVLLVGKFYGSLLRDSARKLDG